jgi:hypothetical protein
VAVLLKIWAVPRGFALDIHLLRQAAINKGLEAIINSRKGDGGNTFFCTNENLRGGRVVTLVEKNVVDLTALRSEAMPAMADRLLVA